MSVRDKPMPRENDSAPARFDRFRDRAEGLVQSPQRLQSVVRQAVRKLSTAGGGKFQAVKGQLAQFLALLKAWLAGDYREVSRKTIVVIAAAVLYFVVPFDVIPDFLFGWGLLDDAAVIGYVFNQIREEMDAFSTWQDEQKRRGHVDEH